MIETLRQSNLDVLSYNQSVHRLVIETDIGLNKRNTDQHNQSVHRLVIETAISRSQFIIRLNQSVHRLVIETFQHLTI